jgi:ribosomal protein S24E
MMNIQITKDEKKPLLKRRELEGKLGYEDKTPKRLDIRKEIAHKLNAKEELVVVKRVKPEYGTQSAHLEFYVYDDEQTMKDIEHEYMMVRNGAAKKEEKKEAAPETK